MGIFVALATQLLVLDLPPRVLPGGRSRLPNLENWKHGAEPTRGIVLERRPRVHRRLFEPHGERVLPTHWPRLFDPRAAGAR